VYSDVSLVDIETGKTKSVAATGAGESNPSFSPDGKLIAYYSTGDPVDWSGPRFAKIYSVENGKTWRLKSTPDENGGITGWTADGKNIIWAEANKTLNGVYVLSTDGKLVTEWNKDSKDLIGAVTLNNKGTHVGFILQNPSQLPEAYISS